MHFGLPEFELLSGFCRLRKDMIFRFASKDLGGMGKVSKRRQPIIAQVVSQIRHVKEIQLFPAGKINNINRIGYCYCRARYAHCISCIQYAPAFNSKDGKRCL